MVCFIGEKKQFLFHFKPYFYQHLTSFSLSVEKNGVLYLELAHGGHLGFYEGGLIYPNPVTWLDRALVALVGSLVMNYNESVMKSSAARNWTSIYSYGIIFHVCVQNIYSDVQLSVWRKDRTQSLDCIDFCVDMDLIYYFHSSFACILVFRYFYGLKFNL